MKVYDGESFAEVYKNVLNDLLINPEYETSPRGLKVKESLNVCLKIKNPKYNCYDNKIRSSQYSYIAGELLWYFSGRDDVKFISNFSKFWLNIQTPFGTANSAYGDLIFTRHGDEPISQWEWAYESLKRDKDTRQAILHFNRPYHQYFENKDFVCTLNGVFHIRDNKLHFTVLMRSNDAILGLPTDVAFFTMLQFQMLKHLKPLYPDLQIGTYTHMDSSLHIYENNFELVKNMLDHEFIATGLPEIKSDFIEVNGKPTVLLKSVVDGVEEYIEKYLSGYEIVHPLYSTDSLYYWILEKIYNKKKF